MTSADQMTADKQMRDQITALMKQTAQINDEPRWRPFVHGAAIAATLMLLGAVGAMVLAG